MTNPNGGSYQEPRVLGLLRIALQTAREIRANLPPTGWRWKRPKDTHPDWCAMDHTCTVRPEIRGPMSEHRSPVATWSTSWGVLLATRVQGLTGPPRLELRAQVRLSASCGNLALAQGISVPLAVEASISTVIAELDIMARQRAELDRAEEARELHSPRPARSPRAVRSAA